MVLRMNESRRWAVCLCALISVTLTCGCSMFTRRDEATASYEQTRRQMETDANIRSRLHRTSRNLTHVPHYPSSRFLLPM